MLCKVKNYHFELVLYNGIKNCHKVVDDGRVLNVVFDENIYVDPFSNFVKDYTNMIGQFLYACLTKDMLFAIEHSINYLLDHYRKQGKICLESEIINPNNYIKINKDPYFDYYDKFEKNKLSPVYPVDLDNDYEEENSSVNNWDIEEKEEKI